MLNLKVVGILSCLIAIALSASSGGVTQLEGDDLKAAGEELENVLAKLDAGEGPHYKLVEVYSGTTQVVSGTSDELVCDVEDQDGQIKKCIVTIWSQPWLENGTEVTFDCEGEEKVVKNV